MTPAPLKIADGKRARKAALPVTVAAIGVTAATAGAMFGVSESTWRELVNCGRVPRGFLLKGMTRWAVDELRAWAAAGAPDAAGWAKLRAGK